MKTELTLKEKHFYLIMQGWKITLSKSQEFYYYDFITSSSRENKYTVSVDSALDYMQKYENKNINNR